MIFEGGLVQNLRSEPYLHVPELPVHQVGNVGPFPPPSAAHQPLFPSVFTVAKAPPSSRGSAPPPRRARHPSSARATLLLHPPHHLWVPGGIV